MAAKYYVLARTIYGDDWGAIAGPIANLDDATQIARNNRTTKVVAIVVNTTTMIRTYKISKDTALDSIAWIEYHDQAVREAESKADFEYRIRQFKRKS